MQRALELATELENAINNTWNSVIDARVYRVANELIQELRNLDDE